MDFTKLVYAEIQEDEKEADKFRTYLKKHHIKFVEELEDYFSIDGVHIFKCRMTKEQMEEADSKFDAYFYQ